MTSSDISGLTAWATKAYPTDASGMLRNNGTGTLSWDTSSYLTANQSITLSGDASGSGTTAISLTISGLQGKALPSLSAGLLRYSGSAWTMDTATYLTANQPITLSGAVTGSGSTAITTTLSAGSVGLSNMAALSANSIIGNNTGSATTPVALTVAQVKTLLAITSSDVSGLTAWATKAYPTDASGMLRNNGTGTLSWDTTSYQAVNANLTSMAALTYVSPAFVKMTGTNTFTLDTSTYLTANQSITLSGDVTGSGTTAITASISATTVTGKALTGYVVGTNTAIVATDSILVGFQKAQGQINAREASLGNPSVDGYVLSSTAAGVRSWVVMTGGGGGAYTAVTSVPANTFLGNNTGSTANAIALTMSQAKSLLAISSSDVSGLTAWATHAYPTDASGMLRNNGSGTLSWDGTAYLPLAGGTMTKPLNITDPANSGSTYEIVITDTATNTAKLGTNGLAITIGSVGSTLTSTGVAGGSASGSYSYGLGMSWTIGSMVMSCNTSGFELTNGTHYSLLSNTDLVFDSVSIFTKFATAASPTFTGTITTPLTAGFVKSSAEAFLAWIPLPI